MSRLTCAEVDALLAALDDSEGDTQARASIAEHAATCAACRALVADLDAVRRAAAILPPPALPDAAWPRLRAALDRPPTHGHGRTGIGLPWLAAAAALLLAVGAALGTLWGGDGDDGSDASMTQVAADLAAAEAHYQRAIAGLEEIARRDGLALDPQVAGVLRANLAAIDGAIRETRAALAARPDDEVARRGLFDALDGKVALLEQTVSLIDAERGLDAAAPDAATGPMR